MILPVNIQLLRYNLNILFLILKHNRLFDIVSDTISMIVIVTNFDS